MALTAFLYYFRRRRMCYFENLKTQRLRRSANDFVRG